MSELIVLSVVRHAAVALECNFATLALSDTDYATRVLRLSSKQTAVFREVLR